MKTLSCLIAAAALSLSACSTSVVDNSEKNLNSLNGEWNVVSVKGESFKLNGDLSRAFIGFNAKEGRVYGNTSCNSLMATVSYDKNLGLKLGDVASTMMMCPDMSKEQLLLKTMSQVKDFEIKQYTLYLVDDNKQKLIELKRAK